MRLIYAVGEKITIRLYLIGTGFWICFFYRSFDLIRSVVCVIGILSGFFLTGFVIARSVAGFQIYISN